jgi:enoyl-CoA hydratase/carnithine racemase
MTTVTNTTKLLTSRMENLGVITLNNPKALHALTQDMIDGLDHILHRQENWTTKTTQQQPLRAILLKSAPGAKRPAFCAGGDVKSLYQSGLKNSKPESYFYSEYLVNHALATLPIPLVSLWDGLVMGGGVGISIHGQYRVATEHTVFAMPECAIGLFPDVGSMWWMTNLLKRTVANFIALTGHRLYASDLVHTGLATHYVPSHQLEDLQGALADATTKESHNAVSKVLDSFHENVLMDDCYLVTHQEAIDSIFAAGSIESIMDGLKQDGSEFSCNTLQMLKKQSPTSLKLTLEGLNRAATTVHSIGEDLQMEYRMAKACVQPGTDFYEGVRAALIDKDQSPKWNPSNLEEVTVDVIESYFAPLREGEEWKIPAIASTSRL